MLNFKNGIILFVKNLRSKLFIRGLGIHLIPFLLVKVDFKNFLTGQNEFSSLILYYSKKTPPSKMPKREKQPKKEKKSKS